MAADKGLGQVLMPQYSYDSMLLQQLELFISGVGQDFLDAKITDARARLRDSTCFAFGRELLPKRPVDCMHACMHCLENAPRLLLGNALINNVYSFEVLS